MKSIGMEPSSAVTALSALAQENRLAIFRLLVQQGPGGIEIHSRRIGCRQAERR